MDDLREKLQNSGFELNKTLVNSAHERPGVRDCLAGLADDLVCGRINAYAVLPKGEEVGIFEVYIKWR